MRVPSLGAHRSALVTAAAVTAVVAVVAGVAIASGGYAAQRVDLGDAAVWVASGEQQAIGRANTAVLELNSVVETGGTGAEIVQHGSTVLVLDRDRASVGIVDATTSTVTETVAVPPDGPSLALAGDRVVVAADGDVWTMPSRSSPSSTPRPTRPSPSGARSPRSTRRARCSPTRPSTGDVARVDAADAETVAARWQLEPFADDPDVQITSVGGHWAVLDAAARILHLDGRERRPLGCSPPTTTPCCRCRRSRAIRSPSRIAGASSRSGSTAPSRRARRRARRRPGRAHRARRMPPRRVGATARPGASCDGRRRAPSSSTAATGAGDFAFLANGDALVLNDRRSGETWAAADDYGLIDNWDELLVTERDEETVEENDPDEHADRSRRARCRRWPSTTSSARGPGRSTLLPVLLNDYDANGDVLVVDAVDGDCPPARGSTSSRRTSSCSSRSTTGHPASSPSATRSATAAAAPRTRRSPSRCATPTRTRPPCSSGDEPRLRRVAGAGHAPPCSATGSTPTATRSSSAAAVGGARRAVVDRRGRRRVRRGARRRRHARRVARRLRRPRRSRPACSRSPSARPATCRSSPTRSSRSRPRARRSASTRCATCAAARARSGSPRCRRSPRRSSRPTSTAARSASRAPRCARTTSSTR